MASPDPGIGSYYRRVLLLARDHGYGLNRAGVERLYRAFAEILNRLAAEEGTEILTPERAERLRQELDAMLRQLARTLGNLTEETVARTIVDLVEIHRRATDELFRQYGRTAVLSRGFDGVQARALSSMLSRPNAETFRTLHNRRIAALAPEIDTFLDAAVARGVGAGRASKDLARIMVSRGGMGTDIADISAFEKAFRSVDSSVLHRGAGTVNYAALQEMYGLTDHDVKQLRGVLYDARRIQVTETNNALREANAAAMDESPVVTAAKWQLSGRHHKPCACDLLAGTDAYGYGAGYYPPSKWPIAPHPHCGCVQGGPVKFRSPLDWGKPKPAPRPLSIDPTDPNLTAAYADRWTERERERNQAQLATILAEGERGAARRAS